MTAFYGGVTGKLPVRIGSPDMVVGLYCVSSIISRLVKTTTKGRRTSNGFYCIPAMRQMGLKRVIRLLRGFGAVGSALTIPVLDGTFRGTLRTACLDCLPGRGFTCPMGVGISRHNSCARLVHSRRRKRFTIGVSGPNVAGKRR